MLVASLLKRLAREKREKIKAKCILEVFFTVLSSKHELEDQMTSLIFKFLLSRSNLFLLTSAKK